MIEKESLPSATREKRFELWSEIDLQEGILFQILEWLIEP